MTDSIAILAEHVAGTLPDSIAKRKRVLIALRSVLKSNHRAYRPIGDQIAALEAVSQLQSELPLNFTKPEAQP